MNDKRKAAIAAYKEKKIPAGIFAVRCAATGEVWVGRTPNLEAVRTRLWFELGQGNSRSRALQARWTEHGADAFSYEELERIEPQETDYLRDALLKERCEEWQQKLDALKY